MYTVTPDSDFLVDRLPEDNRILVASACSGHGFKHSAGLGEGVAQGIANGLADLRHFGAARLEGAA